MASGGTHNDPRGSTTVEMALLLPLLLLVLFAMVEYGRFFHLESMAAAVAADAARQAGLPEVSDDTVTTTVIDKLRGFGLDVTPTVTVTPAVRTSGNLVSVSLSYPFVPLILPQFVGKPLFPPSITANASGVVQ